MAPENKQKLYVVGFLFSFDCGCGQICPRVALIKKNRPTWQAGKLNGIGGSIEFGETPLAAMEREFLEEAGLKISNWHLFMVQNAKEEKIYFYRAEVSQEKLRQVKAMTDEEIHIYAIDTVTSHDELVTVPNLKWEIQLALVSPPGTPAVWVDYYTEL
jgi:8-oxo-dGTP diphosphatase